MLSGIKPPSYIYFVFQEEVWLEIKLKEENIKLEKINIFVETKLQNDSEKNAFWAVDEVRICNENGKLSQGNDFSSSKLSLFKRLK